MMHHTFDVAFAKEYGMDCAVLISNLQFWIEKNRANGRHQHAGRTWTYNSAKAFAALFPYMSDRQIRRALDRLVEVGVLLKGNFNESAYDRTLWYAFRDESKFLFGQMHSPNLANGMTESGESLTDINTDINTDNTPLPPKGDEGAFTKFWDAYPKKKSKGQAEKAFAKIKNVQAVLPRILSSIEQAKQTRDWEKNDGQFIPYPATWLNARGWEDFDPQESAWWVKAGFEHEYEAINTGCTEKTAYLWCNGKKGENN